MNVELLRKIKEKALAYPMTVTMGIWGCQLARDEFHPCGATGCIAGTAVLLTDSDKFHDLCYVDDADGWFEAGAMALGITEDQAVVLFYAHKWPEPFRQRHYEVPMRGVNYTTEENATHTAQEAQILAERIEYFIEHGK